MSGNTQAIHRAIHRAIKTQVCCDAQQEEGRAAHSAALTAVHTQLAESQAKAQAAAEEASTSAADCEQAASLIDTLEQQAHVLKEQMGVSLPDDNASCLELHFDTLGPQAYDAKRENRCVLHDQE